MPRAMSRERVSKQASAAGSICAVAYRDGKTKTGCYAAALAILPARLKIDQLAADDAVRVGLGLGWFRRGDKQIVLTASGVYIAKLMLNLPT